MTSITDKASMDDDNRAKRCKRSNKENIENLRESPGPLKKIKEAPASASVMKPTALNALLQDQIDKEYKIRDGASKLIQACKLGKKALEASKGLFVSNAKIISLMKELQKYNAEGSAPTPSKGEAESVLKPCKSKIALSDVRIPLEWRDFDQQKIKSELGGCIVVFCLFKLGTQVIDSCLIEIEKNALDITFPDKIIFPELVTSDFKLDVELYLAQPVENNLKSPSTPVKVFKKLRKADKPDDSAFSSSPYTPQCSAVAPSHKFVLVAHTTLSLKHIASHEMCETYSLTKETPVITTTKGTSLTLPLWGQFCCRLMAQPECATTVRIEGFINVQQMVSELPAWMRLWCVMRQNTLRCWTYPEDVGRKMPTHSFSFTENTTVEVASRLEMRRPNSLLVKNKKFAFYIACESKDEREIWSTAINQAVLDLAVWDQSVNFVIPFTVEKRFSDLFPMEFQQSSKLSSSPSKTSIASTRKGSKSDSYI